MQLSLYDQTEGQKLRDRGMKIATDHADRVSPGWSERAYQFLLQFLQKNSGSFMTEDLRSAAALVDFDLPPDARAWGQILVRAMRNKVIKSIGFGPVKNKVAHARPGTIWVKNN